MLRQQASALAELMTAEMGKPLAQGKAEAEKCAWVCEYYADQGPKQLAQVPVESAAQQSYVSFRPLGVILGIMPWNFPLWQVFRFAVPALMGGNVALLKHAPNVTGCALAVEDLVRKAGLPNSLLTVLVVEDEVVHELIADSRVSAVTLTGSTRAGRAVAASAGAALKKVVLELGGSDPYLILDGADLDLAVESCALSRLVNSGQSCIAAKRIITVPSTHEEFVHRFVKRMSSTVVGDPRDPKTQVGPLARVDLRDELHRQVSESVAAGAELLLGGVCPDGAGAWYPVTVLGGVRPGMPAFDEELFGPATSIIQAQDEAEAVKLANQSSYGLGAAVFASDRERAIQIAEFELEAGCCFVNDWVKSDPRLPFGGIRDSGHGRELGPFGIHEFMNAKTVSIETRGV